MQHLGMESMVLCVKEMYKGSGRRVLMIPNNDEKLEN